MKIVSSSFLAMPVNIAVSFITFREIEPYFMGIWATMVVFETYANILRFGVVNGMNRELPYAMGAGKEEDARTYAQTTLIFNLFSTVLLWSIVPFIVSNFELNSTYLACMSVNLLRVSLTFYTTYLAGTFRTTDNFNKLSNIQFTMIGVHLLLSPLIIFFKFNGYLLMQGMMVITNTILLHLYRPFNVRPRFNLQAFFLLIKTGFPLFITSYLVSFIDTLPRLFIINFGNEILLGLYAPVLMIINAFSILPNTLGTYFYPKLSYLFGKTNRAILIWHKIIKIYLVSFIFMVPLIVVAYLVMDDFIKFFPKYLDSLPYMKIGLLAGPFVLSKLGNLVNVILKKVNYMGVFVAQYAFFQFIYLFIFYNYITKDILYCAIWTQVFTSVSMFITNFFINQKVIRKHIAKFEI